MALENQKNRLEIFKKKLVFYRLCKAIRTRRKRERIRMGFRAIKIDRENDFPVYHTKISYLLPFVHFVLDKVL